jgi:glutamyl/glutaminyl-tRNA synthetase
MSYVAEIAHARVEFDIADVNKSASAFDVEKLAWLNQQHMMRAPAARVPAVLRWHLERDGIQADDGAQLEQIVLAQRERAKTVKEMAANSLFFFRAPAAYDDKAVRKHVTPRRVGVADGSHKHVGRRCRRIARQARTTDTAGGVRGNRLASHRCNLGNFGQIRLACPISQGPGSVERVVHSFS